MIGGLAISGGPDDCTPGGGPIEVSDAMSDRFQEKWDQFGESLDGGTPASVTFSESEITSRAVYWSGGEDGPGFLDVQVCLHDGYGEATGTLNGPAFFDIEFMISGSVELKGDRLFVVIDDVHIGNIPGPITSVFEGQMGFDEGPDNLDLEPHTYTVILTEGSVTVEGQP